MAATDPLLQTATRSIGRWIDASIDAGWLDATARARFEAALSPAPGDLFDSTERPLVVGLFGGTGVGKSTLLNRIAGQDIARASAERPTSTRVTAYLHHSRHLDRLPADFPMERLNTALHHEPRWKDVLWLDMPDIDSVETQHHALVLSWLGFTDVLLYVVSPERYRDSRGWTLLREHNREHAWLFVFNQHDRGQPEQITDFRSLLVEAGFSDPAVFATSSAPGAEDPQDDFDDLVATLGTLSDRQMIKDLAQRGIVERVSGLFRLADELAGPALSSGDEATLQHQWASTWERESPSMARALGARVAAIAADVSQQDPNRSATAAARLVDDAALARIDTVIGSFLQRLDTRGTLPRTAAQQELAHWREALPAQLEVQVAGAVDEAMARPGTAWQRLGMRVCATLAGLLPLAALGWVAWRVLAAFRAGATNAAAYLNTNFAITAVLLVAIAWALPWWLGRRLRPDPKDTLAHGLSNGAERLLRHVSEDFAARMQAVQLTREQLSAQLHEARREVGTTLLPGGASEALQLQLPEPLRRLVSATPPAGSQ